MALTEDNGMIMPVTPYGGGYGMNNDGGSWWILLLFILLGGWGNGFGGYGNGGAGFVDNSVQRGFDQAALMNGITGVGSNVVSGFGDVQTALCGGFNGIEIGANARQIADMQQMFALQSQLAQCCCDNRLATCQTQNLVSTEGSATRLAIQEQTQAILDQMCADKIDSKNERINDLERELSMAALQASQVAQTAEIISKLPTTTTGA